jgi:hypothetical protein
MNTQWSAATKTVGQSVDLASNEKVFSFDEALALISLRSSLPMDFSVYSSDGATVVNGAHMRIQQVETQDNHNDVGSAILRGLTHPAELAQ